MALSGSLFVWCLIGGGVGCCEVRKATGSDLFCRANGLWSFVVRGWMSFAGFLD